ncbi:cytochrome c-type biogenesis protein [Chelativorans sp. Marseille-P2723]|uniref:cytochrome c-type biogenesis protein n=1 Tax=Chelativorans sp. Marseille-P2723 TaxID=2709133 RepID=UPI00156DB26C|nr:cytochrome c-type biogenesis protein [Chelativorans sp. Marseille-P2723]
MRERLLSLLVALVLSLAAAAPAVAVQPDEILADPELETRARELSSQLRCMVCQNQSIDDSEAELARDLRLLVRDRIEAGDTDQEVIDYVVSRYGEFVLLKPQLSARNALLWATPLLLLLCGGLLAFMAFRRHAHAATPLSVEEEAVLEKILKEGD